MLSPEFLKTADVQFTQSPTYWGKNLSAAQIAQQPIFDPGHVKNVIINYKSADLTRYTDLSTGASQVSMIESADWNLVQQNAKLAYLSMPPWNGEVAAVAINSAAYPTNIDRREAGHRSRDQLH